MDLATLFHGLFSLSLLGSLLAIGLFIIKLLFRQKLSGNWHYYIWILLILRLLLPFTPPSPFSVLSLLPQSTPAIQLIQPFSQPPSSQGFSPAPLNPAANPFASNIITSGQTSFGSGTSAQNTSLPGGRFGLNWMTAAVVWLTGVLAILVYILVINSLLLLKSRKQRVCNDENVAGTLEECRVSLYVHSQVSVVYDDSLNSPALFGLFRPMIIIAPELIAQLSPEELRYIFLHELSHLKRRDLLLNSLVTLVQVIYWFNPLICYALHQMKQDCEIACDATALSAVKPEEHKRYGQTIISLLQLLSKPHWAPGTIGFAAKFNRKRIMMITSFQKTTLKWTGAALALTLLVGCSSLSKPFSPSNISQNQQSTTTNSQQNDNASTSTSSTSLASSSPLPSTSSSQNSASSSSASSSANSNSIEYHNTQYGFKFSIPESWNFYIVVTGRWVGNNQTGQITATGPQISLRDPRWTAANPRQDIPIMIFTLDQWDSLQRGEFHIGAAPISPSELGRNSSYVFALPARYNYAFLPGYQEVETTLANHPLQATQATQPPQNDPSALLLLNMMRLASAGQVINNSNFPAKTSDIAAVEKVWGKPDSTDYVADANGAYAAYPGHNITFGYDKEGQIFEVRSYDSLLKSITLSKVKEVLAAPPTYYTQYNGQWIFGYAAGSEFKIEFVFSAATAGTDPTLDHYNVLYPQGTDAPGREW